jgi:hypothetical protein
MARGARAVHWSLIGLSLLGLRCASILSEDVEITGKVSLQGAPAGGHDGVLVSLAGMVEATTAADGSYKLTGVVLGSEKVDLVYTKAGYLRAVKNVSITYPAGKDQTKIVVEVPKVNLLKSP